MAKVNISMQGESTDLESIERLVGLCKWLGVPDGSKVKAWNDVITVTCNESELDWSEVVRS